jgi:Tol biopolymer transport system component/tRNA A-37 threonylcarbamoyl transferase component Bud32
MAEDNALPKMIGRYEIRSEIGRGGMATVYRGYDPLSKREVAVKVLPHELLHNPHFRTRFAREAEVIAALEHAAIVPVYDFGEDVASGQPFFVMRLMTGGSLDDRLATGPISIADSSRIIARLAPALDRAHHKGIVHRDLKPGNILFDDDGNPFISDFGIAKLAESGSSITGSGVVGTPAYMSPEQAMGEESIDGRSDIYALGAILFQMLTSRHPYKADTPMGVVVKHITAPVPLVRDANPALPIECEELIQKAMAKKREERFQTATELAAALAVIAGNSATLADLTQPLVRPPTGSFGAGASPTLKTDALRARPRSAGRWAVGVVGVIVIVAALAVVGISISTNITTQQTVTAAAASLGTAGAQAQQTDTAIAQINATAQSIQATDAALLANPTATDTPTTTATATSTRTPTATHTATATATPAPTLIGGGTGQIVFVSKRDGNNEIYLMNADGSNPVRLTDDAANDAFPAFSPDGNKIVFYTNRHGDNEIYAINADGSEPVRLTNNAATDYSPAWSPDGTQIVFVSNRDGNNRLYVMSASGSVPVMLTDSRAGHESPAWSPDGTQIVFSSNRDGNYEIYAVNADGSNPIRLTNEPADDSFPVWSPDGTRIAFSSKRDGNFEIYTMNADGSGLLRLTDNSADDTLPAWSPDGTQLTFTSVRDGNTEIYLVHADGSGTARLTDNPSVDFAASWRP